MSMSGDMGSLDGASTLEIAGAGPRHKKPLSRKEKIEEELRLLDWHKMANDAAIKASIMQNKQLKEAEPHDIPQHTTDDAKWMRKVIQQEHIKPLEVNKEYVLEYERREKENEERLTMQVERHIGTLQKLRGKLEAKAEMKARTDDYRSWQKTFSKKKQDVMLGKTLAEIESESESALNKENMGGLPKVGGQSMGAGTKKRPVDTNGKSSALTNVLDSLNKLSDLEDRITCLEKDNVYERMVQQERPSADRRTVMDFKKTRTVVGPENALPGKGPMAVVYSMKPKQKSWQVKVPGLTKKAPGRSGGVPPMRGRSGNTSEFDDDGGGTFLTGVDAGGVGRSTNPRLERARKLHDATAGQKQLRGRIQAKKGRTKDMETGTRRHHEALNELNRRRNEQQIQKRPARGVRPTANGRGASSGVRTTNRHLADFQKTKTKFQNRTANARRGVGGAASTDGIGRGGARGRMNSSRTAPSMTVAGGGLSNRMPNTRGGGGTSGSTLTRRTDAPKRRGMGMSGNGSSSAPAVRGVGGIRALRNKRGAGGTNQEYHR